MRSVSAKALCFWGDVSLVKFHWRPLLYISFYIVLIGAEINAELELQTAKDRPQVSRGPWEREAPSSPITWQVDLMVINDR
jgi:hypothetical protein